MFLVHRRRTNHWSDHCARSLHRNVRCPNQPICMIAFEFWAKDLAGLEISGGLDQGECFWTGTKEQEAQADYLIAYYNEYGVFPREQEDFTDDNGERL